MTNEIDTKRLRELAERLVAGGPKASHVSASECHEISEGVHELIDAVENETCARHAGQKHGAEAEELRAGLERIMADPPGGDIESNNEWLAPLRRLLDDVDARDSLAYLEARDEKLAAANAEIERLRKESDDLSRYHLEEFARYKQARNEQHERYDVLHAQFAAAQAELAKECVEHSELNGHIDIVEQCRDYLVHAMTDGGDPSGKLQDFVESLRIVIDQCDRQRRRANWYEAAHTAGKEKLIEQAVEKALSGARAAAHVYAERVDALGLAADDNDPKVMATAGPIGEAQADLFAALGLLDRDASGQVVTKPPTESLEQLRAELASARMLAEVRGKERDELAARLNTPHTANFLEAVTNEAAHQVARWGVEHDAGKRAEDWIALVAYLLGKATKAHYDNDRQKLLHHIITIAAVCANWHANLTGADTRMRPGVAPRELTTEEIDALRWLRDQQNGTLTMANRVGAAEGECDADGNELPGDWVPTPGGLALRTLDKVIEKAGAR